MIGVNTDSTPMQYRYYRPSQPGLLPMPVFGLEDVDNNLLLLPGLQ